jgi:hypothetical protein
MCKARYPHSIEISYLFFFYFLQYLAISPYIGHQHQHFARQSLVCLLDLYRQTPLYRARKRSKLEEDLIKFLNSISVFAEV